MTSHHYFLLLLRETLGESLAQEVRCERSPAAPAAAQVAKVSLEIGRHSLPHA